MTKAIIYTFLLFFFGCTERIHKSYQYKIVKHNLIEGGNVHQYELISKKEVKTHSPIIYNGDSIPILNTKNSFAMRNLISRDIYVMSFNGTDQYRILECDSLWKVKGFNLKIVDKRRL